MPLPSPRPRHPGRQLKRLLPLLLVILLGLGAIAPSGLAGSATLAGSTKLAAPALRKVPGPSPGQTLDHFLELTARSERLIRRSIHEGMAEPGPTFSAALQRRVDSSVTNLLEATEALDLSQVPVALRPMTGVGTMLMLRSLLSYELSRNPGLVVPDLATTREAHLTRWTIPDTTISLRAISAAEAEAGLVCNQCSEGDFLFSAGTLTKVPSDFQSVFGADPQLRRRHGADLYTYWALVPGGALPPKLFLKLPLPARRLLLTPIADQSLMQWAVLLPVTLIALSGMGWWLWKLGTWQHLDDERLGPSPHLLRAAAMLPPLLLVGSWQWFAIEWINLTGAREEAVLVGSNLASGLLQALLAYLLAEAVGQIITLRRQHDADGKVVFSRRGGAGQTLTLARSAGVAGALIIGVRTGQQLGLTSLTLLALSSVPALAISLGTQQLIRDISDGFSLLLDGQIRAGDRCSVQISSSKEIHGRITSLGMRSARMQQDDGSILTVPNSQLAASVVTNHHANVSHPLELSLPSGDAGPERLQSLLLQVREALVGHPEIAEVRAELEAAEAGWAVKIKGRWQAGLAAADRAEAREKLLLELLQLPAAPSA